MRRAPDPRDFLQRVLTLEVRQGFGDRAAVGGLESLVKVQLERESNLAGSDLHQLTTLFDGYGANDRGARERTVSEALALLDGRTASDSPPETHVRDRSASSAPELTSEPTPVPTRVPSTARPRSKTASSLVDLDSPLAEIKGTRKPMLEALAKLGVVTARDLLYYFPRAHYDYTDTRSVSRLRMGTKTTLVGTIRDVRCNFLRGKTSITTATIEDDTGTVAVRWFNQPYLTKSLPVGARIAITGEPDVHGGRITFVPRDYELIEDLELTHAGRLVPVYGLTKGLYQRSLRGLIRGVVDDYADLLPDFLSEALRARHDFDALPYAVHQFHFPDSPASQAGAQRRLAFNELLLIQLGLLMRKHQWQQHDANAAVPIDQHALTSFITALPFPLTVAQDRVISEILTDMAAPRPMSRLLQGDVGSGKTVVAAAALLQTVRSGRQAMMMAPTEILAEQHFATLRALLDPFGVRSLLLTGSLTKAQKRGARSAIESREVDVVVGTHALITDDVLPAALGLAVTDEQHRFGVEQRTALRQKGVHPHTLAMTATPIPRTLAMTIYGDLDVSSLDEMPPGRLPVDTVWSDSPSEAYSIVRQEVTRGRQAFVICPVIQETADGDMRSVLAEHTELQSLIFPDLSVGLLHGRMKPALKDETLAAFRRGEYHILVATSVVEVGIDVPNATVMVIRDAHRFGLSQLHQFRGRVGRGGDQAVCVLLSDSEGAIARERLNALTATNDGFALAEEDLRLRGPGEFWGTRQSGLPTLRVAQLGDEKTIALARTVATELLAEDPALNAPDHTLLRQETRRFWAETADFA